MNANIGSFTLDWMSDLRFWFQNRVVCFFDI